MGFFQNLLFLSLFVPVVAVCCVAVAEARREPWRDRPPMPDAMPGSGWPGGDGGGCGGDGGGG